MTDIIEVSYTGDLLAHRRCGRAWAYEKHAGFHPYEVVQAMEGRLIHHAMEWLTRQYQDTTSGDGTPVPMNCGHNWSITSGSSGRAASGPRSSRRKTRWTGSWRTCTPAE